MSNAKDPEVKRLIAEHLAAGVSLSEIQKLANEKFQLKLTFLDIRILASELENVDWDANDPKAQARHKEEEKKRKEQEKAAAEGADGDGGALDPELEAEPGDGKTVVEVSKLVRPGTAISGTVKFASGSQADWYVDQTGRLGLENVRGEKPTRDDLVAFQDELQKIFGR